ncbi:universal stress protein [candidate division KSB1 bacterium]|nr:universal stress protein [candidate division KSB1 bacterium]NIR70342.1 universal stress protein [candidate division KSB1 bacterium]NIS23112.1 universal stress protein [candidate division KSB1 bacterium]NIT69947.1 universal stress protein [candidate division KSB1 bacterium]NIU23604.1 universal stress protein [candidate division KSB1 bacterium]
MKKILLIISFLRRSPKTIEEAIKIAKENDGELIVFFVLDVDYANNVVDKLTDEGWIGGKPSEHLYTSLLKEYKLQAETQIESIEQRAREMGVPVRSIIKSGSVLKETLRLASLEDPDMIVITRRKRSSLSRLIFGSMVKTLREEAKCEVKIIDSQ